ncbi:MAG: hypothetical protein K9M57_06620 [Phycisphaerae bacterium]|nr:hypothetical protein [Phycisphaerae bacterium]
MISVNLMVHRPGEFIVENGDREYVFTVSEGKVMLTVGDKTQTGERLEFDLEKFEVKSAGQ